MYMYTSRGPESEKLKSHFTIHNSRERAENNHSV